MFADQAQDFAYYFDNQSFRSKRSIISGVSFTTGTVQNHKKSKTQKVKVALISFEAFYYLFYCLAFLRKQKTALLSHVSVCVS